MSPSLDLCVGLTPFPPLLLVSKRQRVFHPFSLVFLFQSAVDSVQTPIKSRFQPHPAAIVPRESYTPRCVLAGGQARGWTPDSVVVCWRRFLGILGRVNVIKNVSNLERIYTYFADLTHVLLKIRDHQPLGSVSEDYVQSIPDYIVPVDHILPTLFEVSHQGFSFGFGKYGNVS